MADKAEKPVRLTKSGKPDMRVGGNNPKGSPLVGDRGLRVEEGDNAKFGEIQRQLFMMPEIDLHDVEQVQQRLNDYFALYASFDMKPTVAGLAICLGRDRKWLYDATHDQRNRNPDKLPPDVSGLIKKAYHLLENLWETYMGAGKINPVSGIFLGKNNFGYQDKVDYVVTPNVKQPEEYSAEEIRQRYALEDKKEDE